MVVACCVCALVFNAVDVAAVVVVVVAVVIVAAVVVVVVVAVVAVVAVAAVCGGRGEERLVKTPAFPGCFLSVQQEAH